MLMPTASGQADPVHAAGIKITSQETGWTQGKSYPSVGPLFAPPKPEEIEKVKQNWAGRQTGAQGWQIEAEGLLASGCHGKVVSHLVDGNRHYALVRYPEDFIYGNIYPVLVYNHGGFYGVSVDDLSFFDESLMPSSFLKENYFYVVPSYRAEVLDAGLLGQYVSEGEQSIMDWDVDDVMSLLTGVLTYIPQADPDRVVVMGFSRGSGVSLIMAERDPRVKLVCELFGPTNWMLKHYRDGAQEILDTGIPTEDVLLKQIMKIAVEPWLAGTLKTSEARFELLKRSPVFLVDLMKDVEFHHGGEDQLLPLEHSLELEQALISLGASAPHFQFFLYPQGGHDALSLHGAGPRIESFLSSIY
jgi:dipeptidyl aminopeptidase/acylaminoacyl peptidase